MLSLFIIAVYFLLVIGLALTSFSKRWRLDEYMTAGRKYSSFFITGSLLATIIGGSATVGLAGLGFSRGLSGAWWLLVGSLGLIILGFFFASKVRSYGLYTLPQLITQQYNQKVGTSASILIVIAWVGVTAGQILAAGKILSALGMGSPFLWMIIFSLIFIGYTLFGGQYAIIRTDILDIVIIFAGILLCTGIVMWKVGGFSGLSSGLPADKFSFPLSDTFGGNDLLSYLILIGLTYVVGPDLYARLFCAKDGKTARKSAFWASGLLIPFAFCISLIGMSALLLFPGIKSEQAFPTIITNLLPPLAAGIVLAALVSAVMSSASATLWSAGTALSVNLIQPLQKKYSENTTINWSRWGILLLGICSLALALAFNSVISALLFAYTIYTCGVIIPVIAGFYRKQLKITSNAALAAVIGGGLCGLASKIWTFSFRLDLLAFAFSVFLLFGVSLLENSIKCKELTS
jgi:solute:Na+ symporter, SSS family